MGFGIINSNSNDPQLFLYSKGTRTRHYSIDNNFLNKSGVSGWDYTIGSDIIGIESGEKMVLAVYRQNEEFMRTAYEYQNLNSVNKMINEDQTVLLLKIKVEERENLK